MSEPWECTEEWCDTLEQIRRGERRDDVIEEREDELRRKANMCNAFIMHEYQVGMCRAADYHDQWFRSNVAAFNVYYICRAGHADWPCRTVTLSSWWKKKHADPLATKQKWYCPHGEASYKTKWGGSWISW